MRIEQAIDNGNVAAINRNENLSHRNINNRSWLLSNSTQSDNREIHYLSESLQYNINSNYSYEPEDSQEIFENNSINTNIIHSKANKLDINTTNTNKGEVCNRQYRIYTQNNINIVKSFIAKESSNLAGSIVTSIVPSEIFQGLFEC